MKNCGEPVVSEEAGHRAAFELCSLFPFLCLRGRYTWFSQWLDFSLGKVLVVREVDACSYLVLTAVSLYQVPFSLGVNPQHTYVMAEEQSGAKLHL